MRTDPLSPRIPTQSQTPRESTTDDITGRDAEERADVEEDSRRQHDLDDAEMGGEA